MHITAYCPECQSRYQLNADLRGRNMRCPNAACQAIFVVREATGGPPRGATNGPRATDARGELVPLAGDSPPRRPQNSGPVELDWRAAPPPVRNTSPTADHLLGTGETSGDIPVAPMARRRPPPPPAPPVRVREWDQPPRPGGWRKPLLVLLAVVTLGAAAYGINFVVSSIAQNEETRRADAAKDYAAGSFGNAAKKYRALAEKHGRSASVAEYRFLADLSDLQDAAAPPLADPTAALAKAEAFAKQYDTRDPQLKDNAGRRKALTDALARIATGFADAADAAIPAADGETIVPPLLAQGQKTLDVLVRYGGQVADLRGRFDSANQRLALATERRRSIAAVRKLLTGPKPDVDAARRLAQRLQVADDENLRHDIERAETEVVHQAAYQALNLAAQKTGPADGPPGLLLETAPPSTRPPDEVVLAVARGLLYALDARTGRRLWACRVGLDAGDLPARVPTGDDPELVVVAVSDPPGLTARNIRTGAVVWHQPLEAPALGRPTQDAGRLYVPTAGPAGFVYDLDVRTGAVAGRFVTHQRLAGGGAFDRVTRRLYVPAHGQGVFVFSYGAEGPKCEGLLRTNHPAGALRGEPIVVSGEEGTDVPRYLVLGQADGLGAMTLRAFRLLADPTVSPLEKEVPLPGWSWFPPYHDPETIALVTDAGAIGLFGIHQKGDDDPPLFPLLGQTASAEVRNAKPARAQLVYASESGFWVLADGVLRQWRLGLTRQAGRQLAAAFGDGLRLGAPLHAAQVSTDRHTLFVVTQTDSPPAYWATAVNAVNGNIVWQRPLGLTIHGDPMTLGGAVIVLDQSGGLYRFDPSLHPADATDPWQAGGREIAPSVSDLVGTPHLLPAADGQSAWALLVRPAGEAFQLTLRHVAADGTVTSGKAVALPAPLAGSPALGPTAIVLPLTDGQLFRVTLDAAEPRGMLGPTWRALGARPDARGHVVHWKGDEFLVTDSVRRLLRLTWPAGSRYSTQQPVEFAQRLVGAPAALPGGGVAVADAGGTVTLLGGDRPTIARKWTLGPVTAGPWSIGDKLAVVVDRRKLVWLNPDADQPLWTYTTTGDGIESPPRLIDGKLIVADLAGRFLAVDPATGKPVGSGYQFPAEAAPAAAVAPFGPGRLFAPLTDGTVLLLPMAELSR